MARTKKAVDPKEKVDKSEEDNVDKIFEEMDRRHKALAQFERKPTITSITINPNGTIFGLADNKIYVYDDFKHEWKVRS
jgi:hypothetical protein